MQNLENKEALICSIEKHLKSVLEGRSDIAAAYLLGSAAVGAMRIDSDIDIALLPMEGQAVPLQLRLQLASALEARLKRTVDLGVINTKNLIYASEAIQKGNRLVTLHKDYTESMEARLLACYLTFRQDRRVVEESYGTT